MPKQTLVLPDFARYFFTLAIAVVLILFAWVISPFFNLMVYAMLMVAVFYPLHRWMLRRMPLQESLAAFLTTIVVSLVVLIPLTLFLIFLGQEAVDTYQFLSAKWVNLPEVGPWLQSFAERYGLSSLVKAVDIDLIAWAQEVAKTVANFLVAQSTTIVGAVSTTFLDVFIFLITLFFFFRDGPHFIHRLKFLSPMPEKYDVEIQHKLLDTIYAIVMGNFGSALAQGIVAGIGFSIAGINNAVFWATMLAFTSLIPYVGSALIWVPVTIGLFLQGDTSWGIFMLLWGVCLISVSDNVARPFLIGKRVKMHSLLTFLTVLGGIFVFGIKGIVFGPLILSLTVTILHIYQMEYRHILRRS